MQPSVTGSKMRTAEVEWQHVQVVVGIHLFVIVGDDLGVVVPDTTGK